MPLHLALTSRRGTATDAAVRCLVAHFPEGLEWPDFHGQLALHLALIGDGSEDLVLELLNAYPAAATKAIKSEGSHAKHVHAGCLPLHVALECRPAASTLISALLQANPAACAAWNSIGKPVRQTRAANTCGKPVRQTRAANPRRWAAPCRPKQRLSP